jgi:putative nucleotidyltransferase with HDIG domain
VSLEIDKSLRAIDPGQYLSLVDRIGGQIRKLVDGEGILPHDLFVIARHDAYTFSHVTNVAGYAVVLAERLGICDPSELDQIAVGAMLHDIGKRHVPNSILTKPASLTPEERQVMRSHPQRGYEELCHRDNVTQAQLMMVYQHHEHVDGTGYPVRITGEEMHPWARLLAVVDVFDAITGKRPYRRPMTRSQAAKFISNRKGTQFDEEMATCWIAAIASK